MLNQSVFSYNSKIDLSITRNTSTKEQAAKSLKSREGKAKYSSEIMRSKIDHSSY